MPKLSVPKLKVPPNPGTDEAQNMGCKCPVMDNHYGRGYYHDGKTFVYNMSCTVHKPITKEAPNASKKK